MNKSSHVVILAGGQGLRLWPWSRKGRYKPFLPILGDKSLLQSTLQRALGLVPPDRIHIVATADVKCDVGPFHWILEPEARDTAPAIYHATRQIQASDEEATILVLPADHMVFDTDPFRRGMRKTIDAVIENPERFWLHGTHSPLDRSFGFIIPKDQQEVAGVTRFEEKPDLQLAISLQREGALRNTGIFCFRATFLIEQFKRIIEDSKSTSTLQTEQVPAISIDHFLIKRNDFVDRLLVRQMDYRWSDLGTWSSLRKVFKSDTYGNVMINDLDPEEDVDRIQPGEPMLIRSDRIQIDGDGSRQVICVGVNQANISVTQNHIKIVAGDSSTNCDGLVDCADLLVFRQGDIQMSIHGVRGGLVAITQDVVLVASEDEISSEGIREVLGTLSSRSEGGTRGRLGRG
ncbi:MAG: sugar phosphate nucleotidyltransferase [Planctomycetota bacterium]|nr:sugar phosphate nucleotidyltransferase [Planctomycetota bacterium]